MATATGFPVLIRAFELALTVEGLRPRTISNYLSDVRRFVAFRGSRTRRLQTSRLSQVFSISALITLSRNERLSGSLWCAQASKITSSVLRRPFTISFRNLMTLDFPDPHAPSIAIVLPPGSVTSSAIASAILL